MPLGRVPTNSLSLPGAVQPATPDERGPVGDTDPNDFATKVTEAIDTRLGLPAAKKRCLVPLTDAPLFGDVLPRHQPSNEVHNADNVLPPRKHADHLVGLYWLHLETLEPLLDKDHFYTTYHSLFAGQELNCSEDVFVSTLNAIFAVATQLQETIPSEQRAGMARTYFHRAWSLLRPEAVLWQPASMEIVQCLLLIARYLHCTDNPHQTWMAVGCAVRMAQSLGLHLCHKSTTDSSDRENRVGRQVWQYCVFLDR